MTENIKINVSLEADEFIKAIQELKEQIDRLTRKMSQLDQTSITVNMSEVTNIDQIVKRISEALAREINRL